jgi:GNAT superfamily N-acetyltransferase
MTPDEPTDGRRVELEHGAVLTVRPARVDDVDQLVALYDGLDPDDRYLRFFACHRPGRALLERIATMSEHGGVTLVAEVEEDGRTRVVADAFYAPLPDGDGELAITVARDWRGWLGPYLLDALVDAAAARGVRNLEAEVLRRNRPMLALLRRRGYVVLDGDASSTRVAIGATERAPGWPPESPHPRILVESPRATSVAWSRALEQGVEVVACPGAGSPSSPRCPVLDGDVCPLAADADAIVVWSTGDGARTRELVAAHQRLHPEVPLYVQVAPARRGQAVAAVPPGARRVPSELAPLDVVAHVAADLKDGPETDAH